MGFQIQNGVLTKYTGPGGDVTIPEGVKEISGYAFYGCANLTSVTDPGERQRKSGGMPSITAQA